MEGREGEGREEKRWGGQGKEAIRERGKERREREKGSEGIRGKGGRGRRIGIAHPLFSA